MRGKVFLILAVFVFLSVLFLSPPAQAAGQAEEGAKKVAEVMEYLVSHHLSRPEADVLTESAIEGMIAALNDPYTEYLSPEELSFFVNSLEGEFSGIGIELEAALPGRSCPVVTRVLPGSPAAATGLRVGDEIVSVDGEKTAGRPLSEVVQKIRGPEGSLVRLTVRREGKGEFDLEVKRAQIAGPTCEWEIADDNTGYIHIQSFGTRTAGEFRSALDAMLKAGIKGLVLDLRNDPGGYLQAAVDIAGNFLPPGTTVVTAIDRDGEREEMRTPPDAAGRRLPLAVLVNQYTASAAEVLAGALGDYKAATLVGTRTFGKGVVQAVVPLSSGGALKMTVARFLTPRGFSLEKKGLLPQRIVSLPELQPVIARQLIKSGKTDRIVFCLDGSGAWVNEEKVSISFTPFPSGEKIYLPLRFTLEALGYEVEWREETGQITLKDGEKEVLLSAKDFVTAKDGTAYISGDFLNAAHCKVFQEGNNIVVRRLFPEK